MIWGLEGDSETTHRTRPDHKQNHPAPPQASNRKSQQRTATNYQVPPRFHSKAHEEVEAPHHAPTFTQTFHPLQINSTQTTQTLPASKQRKRDLGVPDHGPIDLTELVKPPHETPMFLPAFGSSGSSGFGPYGFDSRGFTGDMDPDWQNLLLVQDRLGRSAPDPFGSHGADQNYLRSHGFASSPTASNFLPSRSPIVLDPPSYLSQSSRNALSQYSPLSSIDTPMSHYTPTSSHDAPQRMSALEIAQKYRQQQMSQKPSQSMLPTPPNSSSPIWSSGFSPQESLWSPELVAPLPWPDNSNQRGYDHVGLYPDSFSQLRRAGNVQHTQARPPARDTSQAQTVMNHSTNSRELHAPFRNSPLSQNYHFLDSRLLDAMNRLAISQPPARSPQNTQTALLQRSPAPLQPPPNTPYASLNSGQSKIEPSSGPGLATPPSPASPNPRTRSISHQHPRSIPLARLVQRRLSSVPEEEFSVISEHSAPPPHRQRSQLSSSVSAPEGFNSVSDMKAHHANRPFAPTGPPGSTIVDTHKANMDHNPGKSLILEVLVALTHSDSGAKDDDFGRNQRGGRGRGRGGRRARGKNTGHVANGPERANGGMIVRS